MNVITGLFNLLMLRSLMFNYQGWEVPLWNVFCYSYLSPVKNEVSNTIQQSEY